MELTHRNILANVEVSECGVTGPLLGYVVVDRGLGRTISSRCGVLCRRESSALLLQSLSRVLPLCRNVDGQGSRSLMGANYTCEDRHASVLPWAHIYGQSVIPTCTCMLSIDVWEVWVCV